MILEWDVIEKYTVQQEGGSARTVCDSVTVFIPSQNPTSYEIIPQKK